MGSPLAYDPSSLPLGMIGKPHATRGQVNLRLFNESSRSLSDMKLPATVVLEDAEGHRSEAKITVVRFVHDHYLVAFEGIEDRDQAGTLTGRLLRVGRELLQPLAADEFYWQDLVGCQVEDQNKRVLGRLQAVFDTGAHGVGEVVHDDGSETLVPLIKPFLLEVNIENRFVRVELLSEEDLDDAGLQSP